MVIILPLFQIIISNTIRQHNKHIRNKNTYLKCMLLMNFLLTFETFHHFFNEFFRNLFIFELWSIVRRFHNYKDITKDINGSFTIYFSNIINYLLILFASNVSARFFGESTY